MVRGAARRALGAVAQLSIQAAYFSPHSIVFLLFVCFFYAWNKCIQARLMNAGITLSCQRPGIGGNNTWGEAGCCDIDTQVLFGRLCQEVFLYLSDRLCLLCAQSGTVENLEGECFMSITRVLWTQCGQTQRSDSLALQQATVLMSSLLWIDRLSDARLCFQTFPSWNCSLSLQTSLILNTDSEGDQLWPLRRFFSVIGNNVLQGQRVVFTSALHIRRSKGTDLKSQSGDCRCVSILIICTTLFTWIIGQTLIHMHPVTGFKKKKKKKNTAKRITVKLHYSSFHSKSPSGTLWWTTVWQSLAARSTFTLSAAAVPLTQCSGALYAQEGHVGARVSVRVCVCVCVCACVCLRWSY